MSNESNKERAIETLKKLAVKRLSPHIEKKAKRALASIGDKNNPEATAKVLALAKMLSSGKFGASHTTKDGKRINGEIDAKNRSIKAGISWDF